MLPRLQIQKVPSHWNPVIDLARIMAVFGVISIHVTSKSLEAAGYDILRLPLTFYVDVLSRFAVPLFFIVSGYVLSVRYKEKLNAFVFYRNRLARIAIPYLLWSCLYLIYDWSRGSDLNLYNIFYKILSGETAINLYFIPAIILLYILFPYLKKLLSRISLRVFIAYSVVEVALLLIDYAYFPILRFTPFRIALLNMYLFIFGMLCFVNEKKLVPFCKKRIKLIFFSIVIYLIALIYEIKTLYLYTKNVGYISSQWQPLVFAYTILIWSCLITVSQERLNRFKPFLFLLSKLSLFVFFIHIFCLNFFWKIYGSYLFSKTAGHVLETFWFTPLVFVFVVVSSYTAAYVVSLVPKLNKALGIG